MQRESLCFERTALEFMTLTLTAQIMAAPWKQWRFNLKNRKGCHLLSVRAVCSLHQHSAYCIHQSAQWHGCQVMPSRIGVCLQP